MTARCNLTDTVLARHLDGDLEAQAASWMSAEALADHARDCAACQAELQAARRLDAALAETSGRQCATGPALEVRMERLLQRAVAAATAPMRPATPSIRPRDWLVLGLCAGLLLGVGFAFGRSTAEPPPAPWTNVGDPRTDVVPDAPAMAPPPTVEQAAFSLPGIPAGCSPFRPARTGLARLGRAGPVGVDAWAAMLANEGLANEGLANEGLANEGLANEGLANEGLANEGTAAPEGQPLADALLQAAAPNPTELCLRASRSLLGYGTETALQAWVTAVTKIADQRLRGAVLATGRGRADLLDYLRRRLAGDALRHLDLLATVTVAAQLGHRDLDAALRHRIRRQRDLHLELAAALRSADRPAGTAKLLLDVFGDLVARGAVADDETTARSLFHGQPPRVGAELVDELQSSRETPRRVRALLALGISADVGLRPILLSWMRSPGRDEAQAAAFALAMLPASAIEDLAAHATAEPSQWLLRTALLRARVPAAERWLDQLSLTAEERALLLSPFSFRQLPIVAACFRERLGVPL